MLESALHQLLKEMYIDYVVVEASIATDGSAMTLTQGYVEYHTLLFLLPRSTVLLAQGNFVDRRFSNSISFTSFVHSWNLRI